MFLTKDEYKMICERLWYEGYNAGRSVNPGIGLDIDKIRQVKEIRNEVHSTVGFKYCPYCGKELK